MKMSAREMFFQSLAKAKVVQARCQMESERLDKDFAEAIAEHFSFVQPLLGCPTCQFAHPDGLNKKGCCQNPANGGKQDPELFRKDSDEAPLCSIRVEGTPMNRETPDFAQFLALMRGKKARSH